MLLNVLAFAVGVSPLLMSNLVTRLYVLLVAGSIFLLATFVPFLMKRWTIARLSGMVTMGVGSAFLFTALGPGLLLGSGPFAYMAAFAGALLLGIGFIYSGLAKLALARTRGSA